MSQIIEKWQKYNVIQKQVKNVSKKNVQINFTNTKYSKNKKFYFPYGFENAEIIVESCVYSKSISKILEKDFFPDDLNTFKSVIAFHERHPFRELDISEQRILQDSNFVNSKLSKKQYLKTLKIANWTYKDFVLSATYFYLETIYSEFLTEPNSPYKFNSMRIASRKIPLVLLDPFLGPGLFKAIQSTNLLVKYPKTWVSGFIDFIKTATKQKNGKIVDCDALNRKIDYYFENNYSGGYYYLAAFNFIIPTEVVTTCSKYCNEIKCIKIIYYILKQYENALNRSLSASDKSYQNYCLSKNLYELVHEPFETPLIIENKNIF